MFKDARKIAGLSINIAALELNIGTRTLVNYENGHTATPPEIVLSMANVYDQPTLAAKFCSKQCPIGQIYAHSLEEKDLASSVLTLLKEFNDVKKIKDQLLDISADGEIDSDELPIMEHILKELVELDKAIDTLMWWARSHLRKKPAPAMVAEERELYGQKNRAAYAAR